MESTAGPFDVVLVFVSEEFHNTKQDVLQWIKQQNVESHVKYLDHMPFGHPYPYFMLRVTKDLDLVSIVKERGAPWMVSAMKDERLGLAVVA